MFKQIDFKSMKCFLTTGNNLKVIVGCSLIILIIFISNVAYASQSDSFSITQIEQVDDQSAQSIKEKECVVVYVSGNVVNPGVYSLPKNSRVIDAINAAGGIISGYESSINLASDITDGQQIIVDSSISEDSNVQSDSSLININTASSSILETLPGIGQSTAAKIINYRKTNGYFKTTDELKNVSGIGDKKYEAIKDFICV